MKFISGLTKTKEKSEREANISEQLDGSTSASQRQASWSISRKSTDKVIEKAEKQAINTEKEGAQEEPSKDRTLSSMRSPSADRGGGATLPVVEEDGEGCSREESIRGDSSQPKVPSNIERPPPVPEKERQVQETNLPSIPAFQRLSLGLGSSATKPA